MQKRGSIGGIFDASLDELIALGLPIPIANNIHQGGFDKMAVDREIYLAERNDTKIITLEDDRYPKLLKDIHFPPPYIYVKGDEKCLKEPTIAIVGSRRCSKAAAEFTYQLGFDLAKVGFTVVSGFAYGIDIEAHLGASSAGATAAVLGSGFLQIYPQNHIKYASKVLEKGCFVSEFAFDENPLPTNFPRRNRIISGLSLGVAVIEASKKSGSLITSRFAVEQNREVFAVPHFPKGFNTAGNALIKDGAKLLETYLDIVSEFAYLLKSDEAYEASAAKDEPLVFNSELKSLIYEAIHIEPLSMNELCMKLDVGIIEIMTAAAELELEGYVIKGEDDRYFVA